MWPAQYYIHRKTRIIVGLDSDTHFINDEGDARPDQPLVKLVTPSVKRRKNHASDRKFRNDYQSARKSVSNTFSLNVLLFIAPILQKMYRHNYIIQY